MTQMLLINGSPLHPSRSAVLLEKIERIAKAKQWSATKLVVRELDANALLAADSSHPSIQKALQAIESAETIVAVTPTYKAAYSGILKALLDLVPQNGFAGKKVLPFMLGATPLHALALDFSFKPLFMALGASFIAPGAFLLDDRFQKNEGQYGLSDELQAHVTKLFESFTA